MNNQDNQNKKVKEPGNEEARKTPAKTSFFAKRWTFPVIYLAASVLIVGLMYAKSQDASEYEVEKQPGQATEQNAGPAIPGAGEEAAAPANSTPNFMWPVGAGGEEAAVSMEFYRDDAPETEKAAALTVFENAYHPNQGVNIGLKSDATFEVVSAAKGTVLDVKEDPLMGHTVEIDHGNGYTTYYASLSNVAVKKGENVLSGQPIAKSGNNRFEKEEKNHLHFEVRKDGKQVDPNSVLPKKPQGDAKSTTGTVSSSTDSSTDSSAASTKPAEKTEDKAAGSTDGSKASEDKAPGKPAEKDAAADGQGIDKGADASGATDTLR